MTVLLFGVFILLLLLDVPVAFCLMISSLAALIYAGIDPIVVGLEMSRSMASFYPFIAVPFFMLAGELMAKGGLSNKIIDFARAVVGHKRGGMAMATTLSCMIFGAVSGASSATTAAIGTVMIPAMKKSRFPDGFATALVACSGTTGAMIPPSMVLIIYGVIANLSIERLFMAGVIPGILIGTGLIGVSYLYAAKHDLPTAPGASLKGIMKSLTGSFLAVLLMIIIFAGILGGIFTATEAAAVAVVYAFIVGFLVYRGIRLRDMPSILVTVVQNTAALSFLICSAGLFSWVLTLGFIPRILTTSILSGAEHMLSPLYGFLHPDVYFLVKKVVILLVLNGALLVVGMFVDAGPALLIVVPVLMPLTGELHMDPVHFALVVVINLVIGLVTPPVGTTLFVASGVAKIKISEVVPYILLLLPVMILVQLLITFIPPLTLFLADFVK
ncbi:TRAP transporter large permease [bacterium]|nr:TRAP transporter large permease [bacterium]